MAGPRQAPPIPFKFAQGLYTNETDRGAEGRWIDGDNVRWNDGLPEKMGGFENSDLLDTTGAITTYMGKVRSTWEWDSLDGETWIAAGTACKLYLINRGVLYDITPMRQQSTVVGLLTTDGSFEPSADPLYASNVIYLECDGVDGSPVFPDASSYARTMTTHGAVAVETADPKYGTGAGLFPGAAGDYLSTPLTAELDLSATNFTIEFWMRPSAATIASGTGKYIYGARNNTNDNGITVKMVGATGTINVQLFGGGASVFAAFAFLADTWYHVAVTYDGTNLRLFYNGALVNSAATVGPFAAFTNTDVRIGADFFAGITETWSGQLDEVHVYRVAKYTAAFTPAAPPFEGSLIATVTDPGHGAQDGDHMRISGASDVGGIDINGEHDIVTVIDLDTYTIELSEAPLSAETGGGTFTIQYDISCGLESDGPLYGYGVGPYGEGTYGTARTTSTFIGRARHWSLDNWGEDLLASPNGETLYEWRRVWGPDSRAVAVVGAPANIEKMIVGPDDRHVLAFGSNLESTGQHDKMFVRWCMGDDYSVWAKLITNDAGSKRLDSGSRLISAVKTRNGILLFSDKAIYFVSLLGGTDVYSIAPAGFTVEIISPEAVVDIDGDVYFMAFGDFYAWTGKLEVLDCGIHTKVFGTPTQVGINKLAASKVHARVVHEFNEIWWSYPSALATENDSTAIYNYKEKCWYFSSIPREAGRSSSPSLDRQPYGFYNGRFWIQEEGTDGDDGDGFVEPLHAFLESSQREVLDGAAEVRVSKLIPDFDELDALVDVSVQGRERPHSDIKTYGPDIVFSDTEFICPDLRVRQLAILVDSNDLGAAWRMGTFSVYATLVTRKS